MEAQPDTGCRPSRSHYYLSRQVGHAFDAFRWWERQLIDLFRQELIKGIANRFIFSHVYILLYLGASVPYLTVLATSEGVYVMQAWLVSLLPPSC